MNKVTPEVLAPVLEEFFAGEKEYRGERRR
jgi:hypothetical protein